MNKGLKLSWDPVSLVFETEDADGQKLLVETAPDGVLLTVKSGPDSWQAIELKPWQIRHFKDALGFLLGDYGSGGFKYGDPFNTAAVELGKHDTVARELMTDGRGPK